MIPLIIGGMYTTEAGALVELLAVSGPWAWVKRDGWLPSTVRVSQLQLARQRRLGVSLGVAMSAPTGAEPKPPDNGHK